MVPTYSAASTAAVPPYAGSSEMARQPIALPPWGSQALRRPVIWVMCSAVIQLLPASQNRMLGLLRK
jgi:hypothetical protein